MTALIEVIKNKFFNLENLNVLHTSYVRMSTVLESVTEKYRR